MIYRLLPAALVVAALALPAAARAGDPATPGAPTVVAAGSDDCSCTARHQRYSHDAAERFYLEAKRQLPENPGEALRLARFALELDPDHAGALTLLRELGDD